MDRNIKNNKKVHSHLSTPINFPDICDIAIFCSFTILEDVRYRKMLGEL